MTKLTNEEISTLINLVWREEEDLRSSLILYPDPEKHRDTHYYVNRVVPKLVKIGRKLEQIRNEQNGHPYWWILKLENEEENKK